MAKIWMFPDDVDKRMYLFRNNECTQEWVRKNCYYFGETEEVSDDFDWFKNFKWNDQCYDVHAVMHYKDTDHKIKNIFVTPYDMKSLKEIKANPQIENRNNAICPVCGYVDYHCWENDCPDEDYECPQCKSNLLLEQRFEEHYDCDYKWFFQRTTFKKLHRPRKVKICLK